jgi:hypothetical protein
LRPTANPDRTSILDKGQPREQQRRDVIVHIADITMFYAPASGGVRTYLDAKHRRLGVKPGIRHSLLIPGAHFGEHDGIYTVPAPALPFGKGYRFPCVSRRGAMSCRICNRT